MIISIQVINLDIKTTYKIKELDLTCETYVPYSQIAPRLKTGDIFVFGGQDRDAKVIGYLEESAWVHTGMVIIAGDIGINGVDPSTVLFWQSAPNQGSTDAMLNVTKPGSMVVNILPEFKITWESPLQLQNCVYAVDSQ